MDVKNLRFRLVLPRGFDNITCDFDYCARLSGMFRRKAGNIGIAEWIVIMVTKHRQPFDRDVV